MVLDLARPSEPMVFFAAGSCFFRSCFTGISSSSRRHQFCEQPQVTESFDLARPSEPWCFAAGGCFFRSCFTGISSSNRRHQSCEQLQATESSSKPWCFTAGRCFVRSCFSREQLQATESLDKCFFSRISDDMLGSFFACFWTLLVLQSHGVLLPGATFFEAVFTGISSRSRRDQFCEQPQATESLDNLSTMCCFSRIFRRTRLGSFFGVVLDLARPSEPWCFAAGSCFFQSWFTGISSSSRRHQSCEQP